MAIEHIRLSQHAKDQLIKLKRVTGIDHWNELCRWAPLRFSCRAKRAAGCKNTGG